MYNRREDWLNGDGSVEVDCCTVFCYIRAVLMRLKSLVALVVFVHSIPALLGMHQ